MRVEEIMRKGRYQTVVEENLLCCQVLDRINTTPGRPGAASVVNEDGILAGFVTDGDIVRRLAAGNRDFLDQPVRGMMTRDPKVIHFKQLASKAYNIMQEKKLDQLPVVDDEQRPVGLIDVQDLLDLGKG